MPQTWSPRTAASAKEHGDLMRSSFPYFLEHLWHAAGLPPPSWIQLAMARWMQDGPDRQITLGWRGLAKTWIACAYAVWTLFKDPNERVLVISKSQQHAMDTVFLARSWIRGVDFLQHMMPEDYEDGDLRKSSLKFDVAGAKPDRTAAFTAAGISGQITGTRASVIIPDDIETPENTMTVAMRKKLAERVGEFENIILPGGRIMYLGTRHCNESLYELLVEERQYAARAWPARALPDASEDSDGGVDYLCPEVAERLSNGLLRQGDPLWPERWDEDDLRRKEMRLGRSGFAMQWLMKRTKNTSLRYPLRLSDLIVFESMSRDRAPVSISWGRTDHHNRPTTVDIDHAGFAYDTLHRPIGFSPEWAPYTITRMRVDPAGAGADRTGYAIVGHLSGFFWVKDCDSVQGGFQPEQCLELARRARLHGATLCVVEGQFGGEAVTVLLQQAMNKLRVEPGQDDTFPGGWQCRVETERAHGQKEKRIIGALEPVMNQHRLVVSLPVAANLEVTRQITQITDERNSLADRGIRDDELDALAACIADFSAELVNDPAHAQERHKERELDRMLEQAWAGAGRGEPTWHGVQRKW